jgi:hypothetical protein
MAGGGVSDPRRMRRLCSVLVGLALLPAGAAVAYGADGWSAHRSAAAGFSVEAPATWIDVTRLTPQVLAAVKKVPALRQYVELAKASNAVKLIVADVGPNTTSTHFATSLNVLQGATIGDLRLQRDATVRQLRSSGLLTSPLQASYVNLPAGKAVALRYRARYSTTMPEVAQAQFVLVHDGKVTVLTYTTLSTLEAAYRSVFARSAQSFRFR